MSVVDNFLYHKHVKSILEVKTPTYLNVIQNQHFSVFNNAKMFFTIVSKSSSLHQFSQVKVTKDKRLVHILHPNT